LRAQPTTHVYTLALHDALPISVATAPGQIIEGTGGTLRRAVTPTANGRHVWAEDTATGKRRNLSYEEEEAFWGFATIEVLRLTGDRKSTRLNSSHVSISYAVFC